MPHYLDAHIHLSDPRIAADLSHWLEEARVAGIEGWVGGGTDPEDWERQVALKESGINLKTAFGLHPWWIAKGELSVLTNNFARLESLIAQADAIGETGLDAAHDRARLPSYEWQKDFFRRHLELAAHGKRPLVLHIVKSHPEALLALNEVSLHGGLVHSFSEGWETAKQYLDLGLVISVGAEATRAGAKLQECLKKVPAESLVIETDAPDQAPFARGKRIAQLNRPAFLLHMAEAVGKIRGESTEGVLAQSALNLRKIFWNRE